MEFENMQKKKQNKSAKKTKALAKIDENVNLGVPYEKELFKVLKSVPKTKQRNAELIIDYVNGMPQRQLAKKYNISLGRVNQIIKENTLAVQVVAKWETGKIARRMKLLQAEQQMLKDKGLFIDYKRHDYLDLIKLQSEIDEGKSGININFNFADMFDKAIRKVEAIDVEFDENEEFTDDE